MPAGPSKVPGDDDGDAAHDLYLSSEHAAVALAPGKVTHVLAFTGKDQPAQWWHGRGPKRLTGHLR
jgi:hypothetical protein